MQYQFIIGQIIVGVIVQAPSLWLAGRFIVGSDRAKFMDAVWITVLGAILNAVIGAFIGGEIAGLVQLFAYLYLVKNYYETSWLSSFIISIVAVIILILAIFILAMIGIGFAGPSLFGAL
jgi:ABC-type amino acid transport system permease subunit